MHIHIIYIYIYIYRHVELQRMNAEYQNLEACYNDLINETFKYLCNEV